MVAALSGVAYFRAGNDGGGIHWEGRMSIVSAALVTKLADFGVKVLIKLGIKYHNGPGHERAERYRREIAEAGRREKKQ